MLPLIAAPGVEHIDISPLLLDARNVLLMTEGGGLFFNWLAPGMYELHNSFLPKYRGRWSFEAALEAARWMFTRSDCLAIVQRVPAISRVMRWSARALGATLEFERKAIWPAKDGLVDVGFWSLRYDDWLRQTPNIAKAGREFHARLDAELKRHGVARASADEECRDIAIGAMYETIRGGHAEKAVALYNGRALFGGFETASLIAKTDATIIEYAGAVIQFLEDGSLKVITCR